MSKQIQCCQETIKGASIYVFINNKLIFAIQINEGSERNEL